MINLGDPTSDTVDLVDAEGGLSVTHRLRRCCYGSKQRLLIVLLALLFVVGIVVAVILITTRSKHSETSKQYHTQAQGGDACSPNPCQNGGTCAVGGASDYACSCPFGFGGDNCENQAGGDACFPNPCQNGGTCAVQGDGGYACSCPSGFSGNNCETPAGGDACFPNPCQNGGTCAVRGDGGYACSCPSGFSENNCETPAGGDNCFPNPCQNGGTCAVQGDSGYACSCPPGFSGNNCETLAGGDACFPNPCQNAGICAVQGDGGYACTCPLGYSGNNCETPAERNICKTAMCYNISRDISSQLNRSVDPCEDFYSYSCGGFLKSHQLLANQSMVNALTILNEDNMKVLRVALENVTNYSQSSSIMKTAKIYSSCVNTSAIDNRGIAPLQDLIEQFGGWRVSGNGTNAWTVEEKMGRIQRDLNVQTLLPVSVMTDLFDSSKHILKFSPSALGMSPNYYVLDTDESLKIRQAYKDYMNTIAHLLGGGFDAENKMTRIYNFEKSLVKAMVGIPYSDDLVESLQQYQRSGRSLESLDKTIYHFCWDSGFQESFILDYLNTAFSEQKITFNTYEKVYYSRGSDGEAKIFQGIHSAYRDTWDKDVIKDYMMWQVVSKYVTSMPRQFVEAKLIYEEAVAGVREFQRWSYCIQAMMTPMDMTLGRLFVDADFDETTEKTVKDMTSRIRKSFIDNLKSQAWMDFETKAAAKEKAKAIQEDVGYPPYIKKDSELDAHYSMLTVGDDYFENTLAMNKMLIQRQFGTLRRPVNKDKWLMGPAIINAYNSPQQNRIVILAGILRSPYYKKNYPKYFNYGSLAMVIAHEITHGFDSQGRLFDKYGNVKDWWSSSSELNFQDRAQCLVNQYSNYEVFGKYIDGKQTLNENIADNGGIKLAYDAYQSWVDDNEKEGQLPDLGLSVDQLFFIGFAMPWCSVYKEEAALYQVKTDSHAYNKYRVIGSLSNFKKFAQAFSCSSGSNMNPRNKCAVW